MEFYKMGYIPNIFQPFFLKQLNRLRVRWYLMSMNVFGTS